MKSFGSKSSWEGHQQSSHRKVEGLGKTMAQRKLKERI